MFNGWYDYFKDGGMKLILDIGETQSGTSDLDVAYAQSYLSSHNYSEGVIGAVDPNWAQMTGAVTHPGTIGLPFLVLFDGDMNIIEIDASSADMVNKLAQMTGMEAPPATCENSCGGASLTGCYCDDACVEYGDCCEDACKMCDIGC